VFLERTCASVNVCVGLGVNGWTIVFRSHCSVELGFVPEEELEDAEEIEF
jgi:hypothetical protein